MALNNPQRLICHWIKIFWFGYFSTIYIYVYVLEFLNNNISMNVSFMFSKSLDDNESFSLANLLSSFLLWLWNLKYIPTVSPVEEWDPTPPPKKSVLNIDCLWWKSSSSGGSWDCEISLHCHYSQVHSDPKW